MGHIFLTGSFEIQGILSPIQLDGITLCHWKMYPLTFSSLDNLPKLQLVTQMPDIRASKESVIHGHSEKKLQESLFYSNESNLNFMKAISILTLRVR
jgi:beta-galactosidase